MKRPWIAIVAAATFSVAAAAQSATAPRKGGNPEAAKVKNPVATSADSVASGKRTYARMCAKCHGPAGKGDGEAAVGAQPADLTSAKLDYGSSDGELYAAIHDGTSKDMEGYGDRLQPNDIWNVVNYVQSLRK
ncbi:MAG TPA: c-type cytochrome [Vicinamibacterales bacterium]|nr:c-type cytochrome [Vicinamibacterales bacterium]